AEIDNRAKDLFSKEDLEKKEEVDISLPFSKVNLKLVRLLDSLKPFGMGNKEPSFLSNVRIVSKKLFGKKNEHLKLIVKDPVQSSFPIEIISFSKGKQYEKYAVDQEIEIVYKLEIDRWNGRENLRGRLVCEV
ncbi:MAG TPA: hypothetical protein VK338_06700, partial [Candidatus Nitrosocosmicus sp.]|nr:hypothetical protein [Candidatus Nitrosocosmicus sp.]